MSSGTRLSSECPIFGSPKNVGERCLPTYEKVMKYYIYDRLQIKQKKIHRLTRLLLLLPNV